MSLTRKMDRRRFCIDNFTSDERERAGEPKFYWYVQYLQFDTNTANGKYLWKDGIIGQGVRGTCEYGSPLLTWPGYYANEEEAEQSITQFLETLKTKETG